MAKYYLSGAKRISIHSDPTNNENDRITYITKETEIDISAQEKIVYGYNNRPYIKVKLNSVESGYVFANAICFC